MTATSSGTVGGCLVSASGAVLITFIRTILENAPLLKRDMVRYANHAPLRRLHRPGGEDPLDEVIGFRQFFYGEHHPVNITALSAVHEVAVARCGIIQGLVIRRTKTIAAECAQRPPEAEQPGPSHSSPVGSTPWASRNPSG